MVRALSEYALEGGVGAIFVAAVAGVCLTITGGRGG
jgi:hypothetical protein